MIPSYFNPGSPLWAEIIAQKQANPSVPIAVILNPNSGPGTAPNQAYTDLITQLQKAGITTFGYVHTSYGKRAISAIETDIKNWHQFYPAVVKIFFDEMASTGDQSTFYAQVEAFAVSQGFSSNVGNAGTPVDPILMGIFSVLCAWESSGFPPSQSYKTGPGVMYISQGVASLPASIPFLGSAWVYITDGNYATLPTYFASEVAALATQQEPKPPENPEPPNPIPTTANLGIDGLLSGSAADGYYTTCTTADGLTEVSSFTPATFPVDAGAPYDVTVQGYEDVEFASWKDTGSTNPARTVNITTDTTYTAILRTVAPIPPVAVLTSIAIALSPNPAIVDQTVTATGKTTDQNGNPIAATGGVAMNGQPIALITWASDATGAFTLPLSFTPSGTYAITAISGSVVSNPEMVTVNNPPPPTDKYTLTTNARVKGGKALIGFYVTVQDSTGKIVNTGAQSFTPVSVPLPEGTYTVTPTTTYCGYTFLQWANGDTKQIRTVNLDANKTLTAVYAPTTTTAAITT